MCVFVCNVEKERCCLLCCLNNVYLHGQHGVGKSTSVQNHFKNPFIVSEKGNFLCKVLLTIHLM